MLRHPISKKNTTVFRSYFSATFMKISKLLTALLMTTVGSMAQATTFSYSYTSLKDGISPLSHTFSGTFEGTLNGNLITGLSNITGLIDGQAYPGSENLSQGHYDHTQHGLFGDAVVSVDGTQNNFIFLNSAGSVGSSTDNTNWTYYFESLSGESTVYSRRQPLRDHAFYYDAYDARTSLAHWSVHAISAVPEPETYALLLAGLGLIGAVARRRQSQQA